MIERVYTQTFGVSGAIIERAGKILLVQESMQKHPDNGKWNQPAGWIDVGEDPITACVREVKEETGLDFVPDGIIGIFSIFRHDMHATTATTPHGIKIIFRGTITGGTETADGHEIGALQWFTPQDIYAMTPQQLRDADIKQEVRDYFHGVSYPLTLVHHTQVA